MNMRDIGVADHFDGGASCSELFDDELGVGSEEFGGRVDNEGRGQAFKLFCGELGGGELLDDLRVVLMNEGRELLEKLGGEHGVSRTVGVDGGASRQISPWRKQHEASRAWDAAGLQSVGKHQCKIPSSRIACNDDLLRSDLVAQELLVSGHCILKGVLQSTFGSQ